MKAEELINILGLSFILFIIIWIYHFLLQYFVKGDKRNFYLKAGVFLLATFAMFMTSSFDQNIKALAETPHFIIIVQCFWWFSLNLFLNKILSFFIWDTILPRRGIYVSQLLRDLVWLILLILTIAGVLHFVFMRSVLALFTASGVMAIILGYSAQATLADAFAGIGLEITKQFEQGNWIQLAGIYGKVVNITWRFVTLLTLDGKHVSIPNSKVAKENITNFSFPEPTYGVDVKILVKKDISPKNIKNLLLDATRQSFKVVDNPPSIVSLIDFNYYGDNLYRLTYYTVEQNETIVTDEILSIFWYAYYRLRYKLFEEEMHGVIFPTHEGKEVFFKKIELFQNLGVAEIETLAARALSHFRGPPERILSQGQFNQSLFFIYNGEVEVCLMTPENTMVKVIKLGRGQYFGEISLLGEPAVASVVVSAESMILEVDHDTMALLFLQRPELVEHLSSVIALRRTKNAALAATSKIKSTEEHGSIMYELATKIRNFFTSRHTKQE